MVPKLKRFALRHPRLLGTLAMLTFVIALNVVHGSGGIGMAEANMSGSGNMNTGNGP